VTYSARDTDHHLASRKVPLSSLTGILRPAIPDTSWRPVQRVIVPFVALFGLSPRQQVFARPQVIIFIALIILVCK